MTVMPGQEGAAQPTQTLRLNGRLRSIRILLHGRFPLFWAGQNISKVGALLDAQVPSEYMVQLGAAALSRADYDAALGAGNQCTLLPTERRHASALAGMPS